MRMVKSREERVVQKNQFGKTAVREYRNGEEELPRKSWVGKRAVWEEKGNNPDEVESNAKNWIENSHMKQSHMEQNRIEKKHVLERFVWGKVNGEGRIEGRGCPKNLAQFKLKRHQTGVRIILLVQVRGRLTFQEISQIVNIVTKRTHLSALT